LHLGDEILAVFAQGRAFGGDVNGVEQLLHGGAGSPLKARLTIRVRQSRTCRPTCWGRQSSSSEQARQRATFNVGGGVRLLARTAARSAMVVSVRRRRSASNGTATRRLVSA